MADKDTTAIQAIKDSPIRTIIDTPIPTLSEPKPASGAVATVPPAVSTIWSSGTGRLASDAGLTGNWLKPNFMPYSAAFMKTPMYARMIERLPALYVVQLKPTNTFFTVLEKVKRIFDMDKWSGLTETDGDFLSKVRKNMEQNVKGWFTDSELDTAELPLSLKTLFLTFTSTVSNRYVMPIMSSPQLNIKTSVGWQKTTSLFPLINKFAGALGPASKELTSGVTSLLSFLGQDFAVGPLFSTNDMMENNPSFTSETVFINDSSAAAANNKAIIEQIMRQALPKASAGLNFNPGALFNVSVNVGIGVDTDNNNKSIPLKKLFLCTGEFSLSTHGVYRDGVTPEVYKLKMTFTSLLPDLLNMQALDFEKFGNPGK